MENRHSQEEPVRAYLLGTLDDSHAVALEEKYFVDQEFLIRLREIETGLISDYLQNRLSARERRLFKNKYLQLPALARRVEEVRGETAGIRPAAEPRTRPTLRFTFAGAALIVLLAVGVLFFRLQQPKTSHRFDIAQTGINAPAFTVRLTPGLLKGPTAQPQVAAPRLPNATVRLELDLPGRSSAADFQVRLMSVGADGHRKPVWTSGTLRASPIAGGASLPVDLRAALLSPGDYLVEAGPPGGDTLETYSFRVRSLP
jgi:hypothetical protein